MPVIQPQKGEDRRNFFDRCVPELIHNGGKSKNQAIAICNQAWNNRFQRVSDYGEADRSYLNEVNKP